MREILFRGKRDDNGEWTLGDIIHRNIYGALTVIREEDSGFDNYIEHHVIPETIGQYTGLTDNNGKKIFEGDIIQHFYGSPFEDVQNRESGIVFWDAKCCDWRRTSNGALHQGVPTYKLSEKCVYEVIGNIHDNPELLGGTGNGE